MPDRTVVPAIHPIEQVSIPEAGKLVLDNNLLLFYINAGQQPVMRLEIIFHAGKWYQSKPGLSYFTGKMLTEGTYKHTSEEIAARFDELGAFVDVSPGFDHITLTVHLLTKHLPTLLPIIKELISEPAFLPSELDNVKKRRYQKLLVDLKKNNVVAAQHFTSRIFGENHPYGQILTLEGIHEISPEAVKQYFEEYLRGRYEIIASGKVGAHEIQLINEYLGQEPERVHKIVESVYQYEPSNHTEEKEDSLQSSIRMGMPFINRSHSDYLDMIVVNEILGGYFSSRLMRNIREDKGFTYGIRSAVNSLMRASFWMVSTDVKKEHCQQTLVEIDKEISILQQEPVPEDEIETVKNYLLGTFISAIDTPFALADKFKTIHYSGLDYGYFQKYFQAIKEMNSNKVLQLSKRYLDKKNMTTVIVG